MDWNNRKPNFPMFYSGVILTLLFQSSTSYAEITFKRNVVHDVSLPLRYMQNSSVSNTSSIKKFVSANTQSLSLSSARLIPLNGFQGMGVGLDNYQVKALSPNVNGDVGITQYVQYVNNDISVFDKATGQVAAGFPMPANSIWTGFGDGSCSNNATGNMTIKHDQLANRWVLSQFASGPTEIGPYFHCVAVSTGEDPTGSYYRYAFQFDSTSDFASLSLWPDAYYLSLNLTGNATEGPLLCALERDKMLDGFPANIICKQLTAQESGPLGPVDLLGHDLPPQGNPAYFVSLGIFDNLKLYKFHVDFINPINTVIKNIDVPVNVYANACRSTNGAACAVQPNTTNRLDLISDRVMTKLRYRQFADYGSIVLSHQIEGPQPKYAPAVRWYEFRILKDTPSFNPIVYQQATHAPNSMSRFIGSPSIDKLGNIAIGYTVSSTAVHPSPEMGWRSKTDPLNTLTIQPLVTGLGSQINDVSNWSPGSRMDIDPVDDCTFWYTNEYLQTTGSMNWSTFILHFKLPGCM